MLCIGRLYWSAHIHAALRADEVLRGNQLAREAARGTTRRLPGMCGASPDSLPPKYSALVHLRASRHAQWHGNTNLPQVAQPRSETVLSSRTSVTAWMRVPSLLSALCAWCAGCRAQLHEGGGGHVLRRLPSTNSILPEPNPSTHSRGSSDRSRAARKHTRGETGALLRRRLSSSGCRECLWAGRPASKVPSGSSLQLGPVAPPPFVPHEVGL